MASEAPLNRLVLQATSIADDLGYVALADLSHAMGANRMPTTASSVATWSPPSPPGGSSEMSCTE